LRLPPQSRHRCSWTAAEDDIALERQCGHAFWRP
jgi:hypothetical protein